MLFPLLADGHSCVGVEPSGLFSEFVRSRGIPVFASLEELISKEPTKRFDLIQHFFVLEHISRPLSLPSSPHGLAKARRETCI